LTALRLREMLSLVARRLLTTILLLWGVATIVFFLLRILPGDPAEVILAGSGASAEAIAQARQQLALDAPLPLQYGRYLWNISHGDFGRSIFSNRPALLTIVEQLPYTLSLAIASVGVSLLVGASLGILSALHVGGWVDRLALAAAVLGVSVPVYWSGLLLILLCSIWLDWLPATGAGTPRHLIMPALVLGMTGAGPIARLLRANLLDAMSADYVVVARAKGLPQRLITWRHALRNAALPAITLLGLQFGFLLGGAVITETVFARPGLGRVLVDSILAKDLPVVQAAVLIVAAGYVVANLLVDLIVMALDPRLRQASWS
jgi:peptide/nickel transport system permease protein